MAIRACVMLAVVSLLLAVAPAIGQQRDTRVPAAPVEAWQRRHDRVSTLKATFTKESILHRGYYLRMARAGEGVEVPDKDISTKYDCVVLLTKDKFKYVYKGIEWSPKTRTMEPTDHTSISTPDERIFGRNLSTPERFATFSTSNRRAMTSEVALAIVPIMLAVRSRDPHHLQLADYALTGETVTVEGRPCVELVRKSDGPRRRKAVPRRRAGLGRAAER